MFGTVLIILLFGIIFLLIAHHFKSSGKLPKKHSKDFIYQHLKIHKHFKFKLNTETDYNVAFSANFYRVYDPYNHDDYNTPLGAFKNNILKANNVNRTKAWITKIYNSKSVLLKIPNPVVVELMKRLDLKLEEITDNRELRKADPETYFQGLLNISNNIRTFNSRYDEYYHLRIPLDDLTIIGKRTGKDVGNLYARFINFTKISPGDREKILKRMAAK